MSTKTKTTSAARVAGQKFNIGDTISWKGGPAIIRAVQTFPAWPNYTIECDNGLHVLEFADQSFCNLIKSAKEAA